MKESPLFWPAKLDKSALWVLDETLIPKKLHYIKVTDTAGAVKVIRDMKTRAFGQLLVVINTFLLEIEKKPKATSDELLKIMGETAQALNKSRPTFPFAEVTGIVVGWAAGLVIPGGPYLFFPVAANLFRSGAEPGPLIALLTAKTLVSPIRMLTYEAPLMGWPLTLARFIPGVLLPPVMGVLGQWLFTVLKGR